MKKRIIAFLFAVIFSFASAFCIVGYGEEELLSETYTVTESATKRQYTRDELVCTYNFTVYGYGHGVGLSQLGTVAYADTNGRFKWNYVQILMHYYPQTHMAYEEDVPSTVKRGGATYNTRDFLARSTYAEIGGYCDSTTKEALKAQIVAIYSFLKYHNYSTTTAGVAYSSRTPSSLIYSCVDEVMGQYVAYDGGNSPAICLFAASFSGYTTSSAGTWGGSYRGLDGGLYSPEKVSVSTVTMDAYDIIAIANRYNEGKSDDKKIVLTGNPAQWMEIVEHDGAYSENIGYVLKLRIGNRTFSGNTFRHMLAATSGVPKLKSHCFSLEYDLIEYESTTEEALSFDADTVLETTTNERS